MTYIGIYIYIDVYPYGYHAIQYKILTIKNRIISARFRTVVSFSDFLPLKTRKITVGIL